MTPILIIDDDRSFAESLAETLEALGYQPRAAATGEEGLRLLESGGIDAAFLDFRLPDMTGLDVLRALKEMPEDRRVPVIMLTAYASADNTIEAMKLGALDHLVKPVRRASVERALAEALMSRRAAGERPAPAGEDAFVAVSERMRETMKLIGRASASDATVLITGETGTGKEMVARALHRYGPRASHRFVAVNCAAIPRDLLESELFGHVRGAFTGATATRIGIFQQADGGTLLLDEIGDMSPDLQAKLLRVLEERVVVPVGADRGASVSVRVLAATHRDLLSEVESGRFRRDLFYRLNVISIAIPPLRERREDIAALAAHFLALASEPPKTLSAAAREMLEGYDWSGNVRELRNVIERATILARGACIDVADLGLPTPPSAVTATPMDTNLPAALAQFEQSMIRKALQESGGNRAEAARRLGIRRQLLYAKLRQYGIDA